MLPGKGSLLLFDIDGTLIYHIADKAPTYNRHAYAVNMVFGLNTDMSMVSSYGKVDRRILIELAEIGGVKRSRAIRHMRRMYGISTEYFRSRFHLYHNSAQRGVKPLLSRLRGDGYGLGVVTGNLQKIAMMKLDKVGLGRFFSIGAFGDSAEERSDLIGMAISQASRMSHTRIRKERVLYFGDTPLDIKSAREAGVGIVAVATGHHSFEDLRKGRPDYLLRDMSDTARILDIVRREVG